MKQISLVFVLAGLILGLLPTLALAAGGGAGATGAMAKAKDEQAPVTLTIPLVQCPMCQESGGLCEQCTARAREMLAKMAAAMCPNCEPDKLCESCQGMVDDALALLPNLEVKAANVEPITVAYLEGTVAEMEQLFGSLMGETAKQGLFDSDILFLAIYPDNMVKGYSPESTVYACVTIPEGKEIAAPFKLYTVPAGAYLDVTHHGSYDKLGVSWMAALAFADLHGMELGTGPSGEVYMSDPTTTPENKWITEIYIPFIPASAPAAATKS